MIFVNFVIIYSVYYILLNKKLFQNYHIILLFLLKKNKIILKLKNNFILKSKIIFAVFTFFKLKNKSKINSKFLYKCFFNYFKKKYKMLINT